MTVFGSTSCTDGLAKAVVIDGQVEASRGGTARWEPVSQGYQLCAGDTITARQKGRVTLRFKNSTIVRLDHNSSLTLSDATGSRPSLVELLKGRAYFFSRTPRPFSIKTPFVNANVEGTEFQISQDEDHTEIDLFEGGLRLENDSGNLRLAAGETCLAKPGKPLTRIVKIKPENAVQWALYYPPLFGVIQKPDLWEQLLDLLTDGREEEARVELEKAKLTGSTAANLLAVQALIALVQNRGVDAAESAYRAVSIAPSEVTPLIALSYLQQSRGDIAGSLQSMSSALATDPRNAVALARYAELLLINGEISKSHAVAATALELDPLVDSVAGITGFTLLAEQRPIEARDAFKAAILRNPGAPMPHLGLGIALISLREIAAGREEIELAAALDPSDSLLRSYLGKAYIEEGRYPEAGKQLGIAKELDPADPTPFLYTAFLNYSLGRPIDALADMERSIERNNNRLVYRSRYLLDQDLSVRLTSLARIYEVLGFSTLALSEGTRGMALDPDSPVAHRFLADSYATMPRHQIAKVSELLQSQLLNPLGADALQPHSHESRLGITESGIQSSLGYNEYASLFGRRGVSAQASGIAGSNRLLGDEFVVTSNGARWTLSAGQFHQETDGFRPNADYNQDIYRIFAQGVLSPQFSLQTEYRFKSFDRGDIDLRFDPSDYLTFRRLQDTTANVRLGGRYAWTADSSIIASLMYGTATYRTDDVDSGTKLLGLKLHDVAYSAETQSVLRSKWIRLVSGVGALMLDRRDEMEIPEIFLTDVNNNKVEFYSLYSYATINLFERANLVLGLAGDFSHGAAVDKKQLNPKIGIVWNPMPQTTLRAAVFRTLKRPMIGDQTIEPTNVAGFNQLYDDYEMTSAWRYGVGFDQRIGQRVFLGGEYAWRDLAVPVSIENVMQSVSWKEEWARLYLNAVLHPLLSARAEYRYERYERDKQAYSSVQSLTTHSVPLGVYLNYPNGFSASLGETFYKQDGVFNSNSTGMAYSGSNHFWLLDASLSYRLPKRLGTLSLEGKNLADTAFKFHDMDPWSPTITPGRQVIFKCSLNF